MSRSTKPAVGTIWYDPENDVLGVVEQEIADFISVELVLGEMFAWLNKPWPYNELVYIGTL